MLLATYMHTILTSCLGVILVHITIVPSPQLVVYATDAFVCTALWRLIQSCSRIQFNWEHTTWLGGCVYIIKFYIKDHTYYSLLSFFQIVQ